MDYRRFYEEQTKVAIPDGFEIHHIDFDRQNNGIINLVALPKLLHNHYHFFHPDKHGRKIETVIQSNAYSTPYGKTVDFDYLKKFVAVFDECCDWVDYRNSLVFGNEMGMPIRVSYQKHLSKLAYKVAHQNE